MTDTKSLLFALCIVFLGLKSFDAEALQQLELTTEPAGSCLGEGRPAPRMNETVHGESVGAPASNIDLNGDGWCDWVIPLPYPISGQLPAHSAKEAILLGMPKGARTFGNIKKLKENWDRKLTVPERLVLPDAITGMAPVLVAYKRGDMVPYFMGFSSTYPYFWSDFESHQIYRWNLDFDMPYQVSSKEYIVVATFWRKQYCPGRHYRPRDFLHPDSVNSERPLEIWICSPEMHEAIRRAEGAHPK